MKFEVNISKGVFIGILLSVFLIAGVIGVYAYNSGGTGGNPAQMGHSVDEIDWSKAIAKINATTVCINNDCKSAWPGGGASQWTTSGVNISYNAGNVSTANYMKAAGICIGSDCRTVWPGGGGSSQWITSADGISYTAGNVGIGTAPTTLKFYVAGNAKVSGEFTAPNIAAQEVHISGKLCVSGVCKSSWPTSLTKGVPVYQMHQYCLSSYGQTYNDRVTFDSTCTIRYSGFGGCGSCSRSGNTCVCHNSVIGYLVN